MTSSLWRRLEAVTCRRSDSPLQSYRVSEAGESGHAEGAGNQEVDFRRYHCEDVGGDQRPQAQAQHEIDKLRHSARHPPPEALFRGVPQVRRTG